MERYLYPEWAGNPFGFYDQETEQNRETIFKYFANNCPKYKYMMFDWLSAIPKIEGRILSAKETLDLNPKKFAYKDFKEMSSVLDVYYKVPEMEYGGLLEVPTHKKLREPFKSPIEYRYPNPQVWEHFTWVPRVTNYFDENVSEVLMSKVIVAPPDTVITNHRGQINSLNWNNKEYVTKIFLPIVSNPFSYWFIEKQPILKAPWRAIWCDTEKCWHSAFNMGPETTLTLILTLKWTASLASWVENLKGISPDFQLWPESERTLGYRKND